MKTIFKNLFILAGLLLAHSVASAQTVIVQVLGKRAIFRKKARP